MTETLTEVETLRAAAEKLRAGVAHCAPEAHNYRAPDGHAIAVLRPELATALAKLLAVFAADRSLTDNMGAYPLAVAWVLLGEVRS